MMRRIPTIDFPQVPPGGRTLQRSPAAIPMQRMGTRKRENEKTRNRGTRAGNREMAMQRGGSFIWFSATTSGSHHLVPMRRMGTPPMMRRIPTSDYPQVSPGERALQRSPAALPMQRMETRTGEREPEKCEKMSAGFCQLPHSV